MDDIKKKIPDRFNAEGLLDPGTYPATFAQVESSILVRGDGGSPSWNSAWRRELLDRAKALVQQL